MNMHDPVLMPGPPYTRNFAGEADHEASIVNEHAVEAERRQGDLPLARSRHQCVAEAASNADQRDSRSAIRAQDPLVAPCTSNAHTKVIRCLVIDRMPLRQSTNLFGEPLASEPLSAGD